MEKNWSRINEARQNYIDTRNDENEKITNLSPEQHKTLQELCRIRHEIHSNWEEMFNAESSTYAELWNYILDDSDERIQNELTSVGLPRLVLGDLYSIPSSEDYFYVLNNEERQAWEKRSDAEDYSSGFDAWVQNEAYPKFCRYMNDINNIIEQYLKRIDNEYGTNYCPSGAQRLY